MSSDNINEHKISVIIPVYNSEEWIRECLDSVTTQTFRDLQIICINDGSTDGSRDVILSYAARDDRILLIDQENKGVSEARNAGLAAASGKYLAFLDSDDTMLPDALETMYNKMEECSLDLVSFNAEAFSGHEELKKKTKKENDTYYSRELDESLVCTGLEMMVHLTENDKYVATVYNLMILRSYAEGIGLRFIPGIVHEDEAFVFEAYLKAQRAGCVNRYLYNRRYRPGSIMTQDTRFINAYGTYRVCMRIEELLKEADIPAEFEGAVLSHLSRLERSTLYKYIKCSDEEKAKLNDVPWEERTELEHFMIYPASLLTQVNSLRKENSKLKKKLSAAQQPEDGTVSAFLKKVKRKLSQ